MASRFSCRLLLVFSALSMLLPYEASAQGFFDKISIPKSVIATGQTETLGVIEITLRQNATVSDTLVVDVSPLEITNTNASDVRVTTIGAITTGTPTIVADQGQFKIPVNAGATSGSILIQGIRVAVAGTGVTSVSAKLSWDKGLNYFGNGTTGLTTSTSVPVIDKVLNGLVVDPVKTNFVIYNSQVVKDTGIIVVHEGFTGAFVNSTDFGQDTPTQIQIRVTDLPAGLILHFPATVTANETTATLTTVGGNAIDISSYLGNGTVVYSYTGSTPSGDPQSFNIPFTVSINGTLGNGSPTIEVSLFPVGAAVPTSTLPATNVTRFAANYQLALPGTSKIITKTLYWTGIDASRDNRISLVNPASGITNLTLTAFDVSGKSLGASPALQSLSANQSFDTSLTSLFGSGLSIATVQVQSTGSGVLGLGTSTGSGASGSLALTDQAVLGFMLPSFGDNAQLNFFNPQTVATSGKLTLLSMQGTTLASGTVSLPAGASTSVSVQQLFGTTASGQIAAQFANPVIASEASTAGNGINYLQPQIPVEVPTWYVPFFAAAGAYETDLSLINPSTRQSVTLSAQMYDNQGNPQGTAQQVTLAPSAQLLTTVSQLFNLSASAAGYMRIQVSPVMQWVLSYYPGIIGYARVHVGTKASTTFPFVAYPMQTLYLPNSAASDQYQGVAILNPNTSSATVTVQALDTTGAVLATATASMKTGELSLKLLTERFSTAIPEHSILRISSSIPVVAVSLAGTTSLSSLRAIPALW
jgi:hypothetical protein